MDNFDWLHTEQTQKLVKSLKENKADLQDRMGSGSTLSETSDQTALLTSKYVGYVSAYTDVLEFISSFNSVEEQAGDNTDV